MNMLLKIIKSNIFLIILSISFAFVILELLLRFNNQKPFGNETFSKDEPVVNQFHQKLGWFPKEGKYKFNYDKITTQTILRDGSRITNKENIKSKNHILLLGGSITQGHGVDDTETFAFKLQNELKKVNLYNFGIGGYGSYQSYLLLENLLEKGNKYNLIIYFFIEHHLVRNYGDAKWLAHLSKYSKRNHLYLPYARLKNTNLQRFEPIKYLELPYSNKIVFLHKIQKNFMEFKLRIKEDEKFKIFLKIIEQMNKSSAENKANFIFINLNSSKDLSNILEKNFEKNKINYIDCNLDFVSRGLVIKNDGHPNQIAHNIYKECIHYNLLKGGYFDFIK